MALLDPITQRTFEPTAQSPWIEHGGAYWIFATQENLEQFEAQQDPK